MKNKKKKTNEKEINLQFKFRFDLIDNADSWKNSLIIISLGLDEHIKLILNDDDTFIINLIR